MKNSGTLMIATCAAALLGLASVATAQTPAKAATPIKGEAMVNSTSVTATVTKIDQKTRAVTVKTDQGKEFSFVASDAVKNLAQVKQGDVITVTYAEALVYEVNKSSKAMGTQTSVAGGSAAPGMMPAGAIVSQTTVTVTITAIDPTVPSVTFTGPAGNTRTIKVRQPEKLQGVNVGDTVDITYAEALGISVDKAQKK